MFHMSFDSYSFAQRKSSATQMPSPFLTSLCAMVFPISFFSLNHGNTVFLDTCWNKIEEKLLAKMQLSVKSSFQEHL